MKLTKITLKNHKVQTIQIIQEGSFDARVLIRDLNGKETIYNTKKIINSPEDMAELAKEKFILHIRKEKLKCLKKQ